jgi:FlaA1/EpsC-like NDP-sugar epimerase
MFNLVDKILPTLFALPRWVKTLVQMSADAVMLAASVILAMNLRLDRWFFVENPAFWALVAVMAASTVVILYLFGTYRSVIRFLSTRVVPLIAAAISVAVLTLYLLAHDFGVQMPRSVPLIFFMLAFISLVGVRFAVRIIHAQRQSRGRPTVIVYGAGASGRQLVASLQRAGQLLPVAYVDDSPSLQGQVIEGLRVYDPLNVPSLVVRYEPKTILLAIPSSSMTRRREILKSLELLPVEVQTIPGLDDLVSGKASINDIRNVSIEDLLGRDPVAPREDLLNANIRGKSVMVTGAGGSIGTELCRQILRQKPKCLVLYEASEFALYQIEQDLIEIKAGLFLNTPIVPVLANVLDDQRVRGVIATHKVDTIYHAAAYKHVPLVEQNVAEGLRNNAAGTCVVARAAQELDVAAFILISTDKAVRPTNFMGASKRISELVCQALAAEGGKTLFSMVRFGNVLGSSGSVVPVFTKQIKNGGPVTVTHPEVTRFFMTIPEAAQLVIQAGAMAKGGDVFVLDMGESVKIADLASRMVKLSGYKPVTDPNKDRDADEILISFTGLRPGEKLYEELLLTDEAQATEHPRIMKANEARLPLDQVKHIIATIHRCAESGKHAELQAMVESLDIGFKHTVHEAVVLDRVEVGAHA